MLSYVQEELVDIWKKNIIEDLEEESEIVEKFLVDLKKEFGREDNEMIKVAELKKVKQKDRTIEKFV